jgi:hypothetical protein
MALWSVGNRFEQRAAAAGLCEPRLLTRIDDVEQVLRILDQITRSMESAADKKSEGYQALRKGMAYCWSVAVAQHPAAGKPALERWFACPDPDIRWILRENLKKNRLERMDAVWLAEARRNIGMLA